MKVSLRVENLHPRHRAESEPDVKARACPDCDSTDTRLSRQRTIFAKLFALLNMSRYKCKACGRRFYAVN